MANILITGATGFVGKALVPFLTQAGHYVRCGVREIVGELGSEQVLISSFEDQQDWTKALNGINIVIHLAARVHIMRESSEDSLNMYYKVNTEATKNLAEQAAKNHVKRFIFLSSIKVNGEWTDLNRPFTEECFVNTNDPYGKSKLLAEKSLWEISETHDMEVVILRPPLIYGAGVKANFLRMMQLVEKGIPLPFKKIQNRRSFIYIDNLISAVFAVLEAPEASNQLYLVADDSALSLPELMNEISKTTKTSLRLFSIPVKGLAFCLKVVGLQNLNTRLLGSLEVSNQKLKSQLGWVPPVSTVEGLAKTVHWYKNEYKS